MRLYSKKVFLLIFVVIISIPGCRRDSDVLARYDGGDVRRWEMRTLFRLRFQNEATKNAAFDNQHAALREYSLAKIGALEANRLGLDQSADFMNRIELLDKQSKISAFKAYLQENSGRRDLTFMEVQYLYIASVSAQARADNRNPAERSSVQALRGGSVEEMIRKLNDPAMSESDIEDFIVSRTEKPPLQFVGGYDLPIYISSGSNEQRYLTDALGPAPLKKFILVSKGLEGIWIARKYRVSSIKHSDIESYLRQFFERWAGMARAYADRSPDPNIQEEIEQLIPVTDDQIDQKVQQYVQYYSDMEKNNIFLDRLESLKKRKNFVMNVRYLEAEKIFEGADDDWIYSIGGNKILLGGIKKLMRDSSLTAAEHQRILETVIAYELFSGESEFENIIDFDLYRFIRWDNRSHLLLSMLASANESNDAVSESQMRDWYSKYSRTLYRGKSFDEVRPVVRMQLERVREVSRSRTGAEQHNWQEALLNKYKLKIDEDELDEFEL